MHQDRIIYLANDRFLRPTYHRVVLLSKKLSPYNNLMCCPAGSVQQTLRLWLHAARESLSNLIRYYLRPYNDPEIYSLKPKIKLNS